MWRNREGKFIKINYKITPGYQQDYSVMCIVSILLHICFPFCEQAILKRETERNLSRCEWTDVLIQMATFSTTCSALSFAIFTHNTVCDKHPGTVVNKPVAPQGALTCSSTELLTRQYSLIEAVHPAITELLQFLTITTFGLILNVSGNN